MFGIGNGLADGDVLDAGETDDVAGERFLDLDAPQAIERKQLRDLRFLRLAIQLADDDRVVEVDLAVEDAADGDASQVVAGVEVRHQHLQRRV